MKARKDIAQAAMKNIASDGMIPIMRFRRTASNCRAYALEECQRGFTLIELVMVIVILGVLSVVAAPRIFNRNDFDARGFHDVTQAYLRYAQKTAIAQRRTVCVAFTINTVSMRIANAAGGFSCAAGNGIVLNGPDANLAAAGGTASYVAPVPGAFNFDALGQPVDGLGAALASQVITVANTGRTITVEAGSGYVHD